MSKKRSLKEFNLVHPYDLPLKKRRKSIRFRVDSYYIPNCINIYETLLNSCNCTVIPCLICQLISEFSASIQVKCNDCNTFKTSLDERKYWKKAWNSGLKYVVQDINYQFDKEYYIINPDEKAMNEIKILCAKCELNAHCNICDYRGKGFNEGDMIQCNNCNEIICKSCCNETICDGK